MTTNNTLSQKAARRKLSLLELASELDNVSKACRIMGIPENNSMKSGETSRPSGQKV